MDDTIAHNIVRGIINTSTGADEFNNRQSISDVTVKHVRVHDNGVSGSRAFGILVANNGSRNVLTDLTITENTVSRNREDIDVRNGWQNFFYPEDDGAPDNRLDVTITDNLVMGLPYGVYPTEGWREQKRESTYSPRLFPISSFSPQPSAYVLTASPASRVVLFRL